MPAYVIAGINVTDPDDYINYASQTVESAEKAGGRFLVKGGEQHILEGAVPGRHAVIEFPSKQAALDWYHSDEYKAILPIALRASDRYLMIVEGV